MEHLGIDWSYRRAAWCSLNEAGGIIGEGVVPADADGLARLVIPGVDDLLGLTLASEIGDVARFGSPRKLIG